MSLNILNTFRRKARRANPDKSSPQAKLSAFKDVQKAPQTCACSNGILARLDLRPMYPDAIEEVSDPVLLHGKKTCSICATALVYSLTVLPLPLDLP